jgi:hypothetical protein
VSHSGRRAGPDPSNRWRTGTLLWSLDLGTSVGDPIAADIDGDGTSEVLVPAADGYLYAIGPRT